MEAMQSPMDEDDDDNWLNELLTCPTAASGEHSDDSGAWLRELLTYGRESLVGASLAASNGA